MLSLFLLVQVRQMLLALPPLFHCETQLQSLIDLLTAHSNVWSKRWKSFVSNASGDYSYFPPPCLSNECRPFSAPLQIQQGLDLVPWLFLYIYLLYDSNVYQFYQFYPFCDLFFWDVYFTSSAIFKYATCCKESLDEMLLRLMDIELLVDKENKVPRHFFLCKFLWIITANKSVHVFLIRSLTRLLKTA